MDSDLGLALLIYIIIVLYIHNNYQEFINKNHTMLPLIAVCSYYLTSLLIYGK